MARQVLNVKNLGMVPFSDIVRRGMETAFADLMRSGTLSIDFSGSTGTSRYQLRFVMNYTWNSVNRDRFWYRPGILGMTGDVNVEAIRRRNYCHDVRDSQTCEPVVRNSSQELGKAITDTAIHEAAHLFGLVNGGPDGSGHTGDPSNFMFINTLHSDYVPFLQDYRRTKKCRIRRGDTLSGIADRIGFHPPLATWRTLYDFRGQDGRRNRDLLRSRDPNLIFCDEEIWIPDISPRLSYMRSLELQTKQFTAVQIAAMKRFLASGTTLFNQ